MASEKNENQLAIRRGRFTLSATKALPLHWSFLQARENLILHI